MGRKPLPEGKRKITITFRMKRELVEKIRKIDNYNVWLENKLEEYFKQDS